MKNYIKLVNFEMNRFMKIFLSLVAIVLVSQIAGVIIMAKGYMNRANKAIYEDLIPKEEFLSTIGPMSFIQIAKSVWFIGPIALCAAAVAFYIFLIWYRDWFGKNTFIYRLLMLPTERLNIFLSKATTILLVTFGFVAFQFIILPLEKTILKWMVPKEFRLDMGTQQIIEAFPELQLIIPASFIEFVLYYGAGLLVVSILFTAILFERSYRLKGILIGIIYSGLAGLVMLMPLLVQDLLLDGYFYPLELLAISVVLGLVLLAGTIWLSSFLLQKKVTV